MNPITLYSLIVLGIAVIGAGSITAIQIFHQGDNAAVITTLIGFLGSLAGFFTLLIKNNQNTQQLLNTAHDNKEELKNVIPEKVAVKAAEVALEKK